MFKPSRVMTRLAAVGRRSGGKAAAHPPVRMRSIASSRGWLQVLALALIWPGLGCRTVAPQPTFDLGQPGWDVRQGQAVWRSKSDAPEIAGELLVAIHPERRSFVQFTKVPLPLVLAQATDRSWQIEFAADGKRYSGRGAPPSRLVWFQLVRCLNGQRPAKGWTFNATSDGQWRLENGSTGEVLEGYLASDPGQP